MISTLADLKQKIEDCAWFSNLGKGRSETENVLFVPSIDPWNTTSDIRHEFEWVAIGMNWLPTNIRIEDPFHPRGFTGYEQYKSNKSDLMDVYKLSLKRLRSLPKQKALRTGSQDFNEAAIGAAAFAFRAFAGEMALGLEQHWATIIDLYLRGHWPLGTLPNKRLVVL